MTKIHNWKQFNESVEQSEVQKEVRKDIEKAPKREKNAYQKFFSKVLNDKYKAKSLGELDKETRAEFFKYIKTNWALEKEKMSKKVNENIVDYNQQMAVVKGEVSKIRKGIEGGMIDLGVVGQTSDIFIKNIKKTYPDAEVKVVDGRYVLKLAE